MEEYHMYVEFLAGVLNYNPDTKKVSPDSRRGKFVAYHDKNSEKRIKWFDLDNKNNEAVSLYVFQSDARFAKVVKAPGRVFLLDFESNTDKYFFWMQEPDASKDSEFEKKVNEIINLEVMEEEQKQEAPEQQASAPIQQQGAAGFGGPTAGPVDNQKIQEMSNQLTQALMHYAQMNRRKRESPLLSDVLSPKFTDTVADDAEYKDLLIPLLPEGQQTAEGLRENLKSPQFQQALETLEQALASEEGAAVLMSMGLDANLFYETPDGVEAFYNALIKFGKEGEKK